VIQPGRAPKTIVALLGALLLAAGAALAQPAEVPDAAHLKLALEKLEVVGSALYVAAHPDDENTALLAWWANGRKVRTAYLAMTRGDGGQNLIGTEKGDLMGVIRTQELLAARRIDGARQFFTRAIDFGYSKSPEEALAIWGEDAVLGDVVRVIREFRPDVVVTRFPVTGEGGHGHHTASAILAEKAFAAAGDPDRFPEQLAGLRPWQPKRLLWNVFRFRAETPREDRPGQVSVDLGAYSPLLGKSYTEIAALSRSMHKSQGFGAAERRGTWLNDFLPRLGEPPAGDLFDGVDLTWDRIPGSEAVARLVGQANDEFDPAHPERIVPILVRAWEAMGELGDDPLVAAKRAEALDLIRGCAGLWLEAIATAPTAAPGQEIEVDAVALNRSSLPIALESIELSLPATEASGGPPLAENEPVRVGLRVQVPADAAYSNPYWLAAPHGKGLFTVKDPGLVGRPESPPALVATFTLGIAGRRLRFETPVAFRWTDPVRGEQYRRFGIAPPVTLGLDEQVYLFAGDAAPRSVRVVARAGRDGVEGTARLASGPGWKIEPATRSFSLAHEGDESELLFAVTPPAAAAVASLDAIATVDGRDVDRALARVDYPHIPIQTVFPKAEAKLVRVDLATRGRRIGYVMGSGDEVPATLRQIGYEVDLLNDDDLAGSDLSRYDALVAGVRAYNTRPRLRLSEGRLLDYVREGGTLVVQYVTTADRVTDDLGPYPFALSHDRVTVEEAPVRFVSPQHPLLQVPNRIGPADFEGWVQERGLYFASEREGEKWDPRYETVLASHDPGESDKAGGLLYARYGKGVYIYTGYSFFRELPAGVPGAVRLFANLVSARGDDAPDSDRR